MRKLLGDLENMDNYIDDILMHTVTWEEHLEKLNEVLIRLRHANLTMKPQVRSALSAMNKLSFLIMWLRMVRRLNTIRSKVRKFLANLSFFDEISKYEFMRTFCTIFESYNPL